MPLWPILFATLVNLWIWKMFLSNIFIALLSLTVSIALYFITSKLSKVFLLFFALLIYLQWSTTSIRPLTELDNDEKRVQQDRLNAYPPVVLQIAGRAKWLPVAHWFEGRKESIAAFRILDNLGATLEPNIYFFANHPRERVGFTEFEKFPYILLPLFLFGLLTIIKTSNLNYFLAFFAPVILLSFIGHRNNLGPFLLFPFFTTCLAFGIYKYWEYLKKRMKLKIISVTLFLFVFLEALAYTFW